MNRRNLFAGLLGLAVTPVVASTTTERFCKVVVDDRVDYRLLSGVLFTETYRGVKIEFDRYASFDTDMFTYRVRSRFGKPRNTYALGTLISREALMNGERPKINNLRFAMHRTIDLVKDHHVINIENTSPRVLRIDYACSSSRLF